MLLVGCLAYHELMMLLRLSCWLPCLHRKKRFTSFPSPAGMSLTELPLGRNNSVMTSLFPPRESLVVTSRLGPGNSRNFFYGVLYSIIVSIMCSAGSLATWLTHYHTKCIRYPYSNLCPPRGLVPWVYNFQNNVHICVKFASSIAPPY